jgi:hypothetical protein
MLAARFAFYAGATNHIRAVATVADIAAHMIALSFSKLVSRHREIRERLINT